MTMACGRKFPKAEVLGIDLNESRNQANNDIVAKLGIDNVEFRTFDAMRITELGRFDLIISTDMLEHLEDDEGGARMFYDALNPGGHLLVHVPHLTRNTFGWRRENWMDVDGHVRPGYTMEGLTRLLDQAGLVVKRCVYNYNSCETLANDLSKLITGAKERRKGLYALCFPILMAVAWIGSMYDAKNDGSGLVALAQKP